MVKVLKNIYTLVWSGSHALTVANTHALANARAHTHRTYTVYTENDTGNGAVVACITSVPHAHT